MTGLTVATWNMQWKLPGSDAAALMRARLAAVSADILCLTEAYADTMGSEGHLIEAEPDYGYPIIAGRRKVLLWSRTPWEAVDRVGHPDLPPGRFVGGRTITPAGPVDIVGVCIPWRDAHVSSGRRDRAPWQDHLACLAGLGEVLRAHSDRTVVLGDFNQQVPRKYAPPNVFGALETALPRSFTLATTGPIAPLDRATIDHVAHGGAFAAREVIGLSNIGPDGRLISDHFGVAVTFGAGLTDPRPTSGG